MEKTNNEELKLCEKNINDFYNLYNDIYNEVKLWDDMLSDEVELLPNFKKNVEAWINKYYNKISKVTKQNIEKLKNPLGY